MQLKTDCPTAAIILLFFIHAMLIQYNSPTKCTRKYLFLDDCKSLGSNQLNCNNKLSCWTGTVQHSKLFTNALTHKKLLKVA